jgi:hypothetical protein
LALARVSASIQINSSIRVVVGRFGGGLDDEDVFAAHILVDAHEELAVSESFDLDIRQRRIKIVRNRLGQRFVGVAAHQFHGSIPADKSLTTAP